MTTPDAIRRASEGRLLAPEEELALGRLLRGPDPELAQQARALLVERNMRLCWRVALRYRGQGLEVDDLVQHAAIGLLRALETWEPGKARLSTYATWWVWQGAGRALRDHGAVVRLPVHLHARLRKIDQSAGELAGELGRAPTDAEIALAAGITLGQLATARAGRAASRPVSLDAPIPGSDATLGSVVAGDIARDGEALDALEEAGRAAQLRRLLARLPERQRRVLELRHGLGEGDAGPMTLEEAGRALGVTRERARQIEAEALAALREAIAPRPPGPPVRPAIEAALADLAAAGGLAPGDCARIARAHRVTAGYVRSILADLRRDARQAAAAAD